jgi:hypothetical protein
MRVSLLILISFFLLGNQEPNMPGKWVIDTSSKLFIHGYTNVNQFTCAMDCYNNADTLEYIDNYKSCDLTFNKNKNEMSIPVRSFDCGNNMITKDFWHTIRAEKHPNLRIRFISIEKLNNANSVGGTVEIVLAGVTKQYNIRYRTKASGNTLQLKGTQLVCFSDFGLTPPQRMLGLIQVQENLKVEFNLMLKSI